MTPRPSQRLGRLPPYIFAELERLQEEYRRRGVEFISLGIGDPDLPPPASLVEDMVKALREPYSHNYSTSEGEPYFREAVAQWYKRRYGVDLDPDLEVCAVIGSKEGLAHIGRAYLDVGDRALIPNPGYPVYAQGSAILSDAQAVEFNLYEERGFQPSFEDISVGPRTKLLFLNYPSNPTGAVATERTLAEAMEFAHRNNLLLCYDNAYGELVYDSQHSASPLQLKGAKDCVVEFNSCSKIFSVTGYRVGFAVGSSEAIKSLKKVKYQIDSGVPKFIQRACANALIRYFDDEFVAELDSNRKTYRRRLEVLTEGLRKLGFRATMPQATFYLWLNVGCDGLLFAKKLFEVGVVATPGEAFGSNGKNYVRFAVTQPEQRIAEAVERIATLGVEAEKDII